MHPIFLSMGGTKDTNLAAKVKEHLPDGLVYMYTRNGEEGAEFRREIEAEVNNCRLFVVFWSEDYLNSDHAKLELATFKRSAEALDSGRELLIVQTTRKPPNIQRRWKNPINGKDELNLGRWRLERAVSPDRDAHSIAELILRKLESTGFSTSILIPRPDIQKSIGTALDAGGYYKKEFVFIAGSEGDGRRTAIKTYMESSKHLLPKMIAFDNAEGPQDVLERLLEYSGEPIRNQIEVIKKINSGELDPIKEIRKIIHRFRSVKSYLILIMDRYSGVDPSLGIPKWVAKAVEPFVTGPAPLIFFVTSNPVTDDLLRYFPNAGRARIPGFEESKMGELVFNLSHVDPNPGRWTPEMQSLVAKTSGSSPSLCQKIMRLAASESDLNHLERIARAEEEKFSASLTGLLSYIVEKFQGSLPDLTAMQIVEKLGIVATSTLDEIMVIQNIGHYDLYGLLQYGVFEQLSDNLIRIPPLLQRRLGFVLWSNGPNSELDKALQEFGARAFEIDDGHGIVYLANKAAASLRSIGSAPTETAPFITLSTLFKTGIERYIEENYEIAHSILGRAMDRLSESPDYVDESIYMEIVRYFGLASARIENDFDVERAKSLLLARFKGTKKELQAQAMASFLSGFRHRVAGEHRDALVHFEEANSVLKNISHAARQHGAVLTEISRSNLRLNPPRLDAAVRAAQEAYARQNAIHNLNTLIKAKILRFSLSSDDQSQLAEIRSLLDDLNTLSKRAGREFHLVRSADLSLVLALKNSYENKVPLDLSDSIKLFTQALQVRRSDQNQFQLWKIKSLHQAADLSGGVISEAITIYSSPNIVSDLRKSNAAKALILSYAKSNKVKAKQVLASYRGLSASQRDFLNSWLEGRLALQPSIALPLERL